MILEEAVRSGLDYESATALPLSMVQDVIASRQILEEGYERELTGADVEADFLRVMSAR